MAVVMNNVSLNPEAVTLAKVLKAAGYNAGDIGKWQILGVSCGLSEAEVHWRAFLIGLKERGIGIPDLVTSDAHSGWKASPKASFSAPPWQRCQFHLQ